MIKFAVAAAIGLLAFVLWRNWVRRRQAAYIEAFPYRQFLDRRLAGRRPELTPEQREEVFAALLDYFVICRRAGRQMVSMPSQAVDDAWHEFILFTRRYDSFCRAAFGRFLHHTPAEAMRSPTQASEGLRRAWRLACAHENINPQKPERLPRLFAIDARLGLADGFIYQLDCLASGHAGSAYCASHIGCGGTGGCAGGDGYAGDSDGSGSADGGGSPDGGGCGGGCGGGGD